MEWIRFCCCLALVFPLVALSDGALYAQAPFYQRKTLIVVVSSDAGGTSDLRVKSLMPYLQKYLPGNPKKFPATPR
jgi:tripartite-type tricarboxylate transporter receptor subunit TctC